MVEFLILIAFDSIRIFIVDEQILKENSMFICEFVAKQILKNVTTVDFEE